MSMWRERKINKRMREMKQIEKGREEEFTCIPEASERRFTLLADMSFLSPHTVVMATISIGQGLGITALSHGGTAVSLYLESFCSCV